MPRLAAAWLFLDRPAPTQGGEDALVAEAEDRDIRRFRKLGGARVAGAVEDARVIRVDRKDPAGKPDTFERGDDPTARCRLVGGANYRDRFRSEQRVKPHCPTLCRTASPPP